MYWNNGRFHKNITIGEEIGTVYVTDHKHIAIYGTKEYTHYGETNIDSRLNGKKINIAASDNLQLDGKDVAIGASSNLMILSDNN